MILMIEDFPDLTHTEQKDLDEIINGLGITMEDIRDVFTLGILNKISFEAQILTLIHIASKKLPELSEEQKIESVSYMIQILKDLRFSTSFICGALVRRAVPEEIMIEGAKRYKDRMEIENLEDKSLREMR